MFKRQLQASLQADLAKKMVWLVGPRQSGKTTLARSLAMPTPQRYYNWDIDSDRRLLLASELDPDARLWILDEVHKFRTWRNWLKGLYDAHHANHAILVTGSARLDLYGRGGDSLQGRYYLHHLHPLTLSEACGVLQPSHDPWGEMPAADSAGLQDGLVALMRLGGFPEPFASASEREASRWRLSYGARLVREDVRDLEAVQDLARLELLYDRLGQVVGSPLSINALREDLEVAFATVKKWLAIFERLYATIQLPPYGPARIKAVKKESKLYLWDWARVDDEAARFENLVAIHLMAYVHWLADVHGIKAELRYFRTPKGQEVDFILLKDRKPWVAVEVKLDDRPLDPNLKYFLERVPTPFAFQVSLRGRKDALLAPINGCRVRSMTGSRFLAQLV
jgi:predicted AAA+ superfamily ATPase